MKTGFKETSVINVIPAKAGICPAQPMDNNAQFVRLRAKSKELHFYSLVSRFHENGVLTCLCGSEANLVQQPGSILSVERK